MSGLPGLWRRPPHAWREYERRYDRNQVQAFEAALNRAGRSLRAMPRILEFGCGRGRLISLVSAVAPGAELFGCDVLPRAVAAARARCPRGLFAVNGLTPPLPYADAQFDLVYSYSVFTHLSEEGHKAWLAELARLVRPGGAMLHTLHTLAAVRRMALFSPEQLSKYALGAPVDAFLADPTRYHYAIDNPATPAYGLAIMTREYMQDVWPQVAGMRLGAHVEGAIEAYPEGCQDIVVLLKEPTR